MRKNKKYSTINDRPIKVVDKKSDLGVNLYQEALVRFLK